MKNNLSLLQLVDSAFPTGAFAHSFGLETAFKENKLSGPKELYEWLQDYIRGSLIPTEGIAVFVSYQTIQKEIEINALPETVQEDLQRLDQKLTFSKKASESRDGTVKIGKRYLKIVHTLYPEAGLDQYAGWINERLCYGNPAIVHGWISAYLDIPCDQAIFTHLYTNVNNLLQSALRMAVIGQTDAQLILQRLYPLMDEEAEQIVHSSPGEKDLCNYAIVQETEAMRHETLYSRLFMS
ncbi:urease accessory protein UreF [Scopulibacillus darangshiensis]|nr:urease accessory UreF family protein [Scopulibacillus darangshiensis]